MLIAIEGIDGAGTTTQAKRLTDTLSSGEDVLLTRQPSDGPVGQLIREYLKGRDADLRMMALLFAADRVDHVKNHVEPALAAGRVVVSDRWYHSSFAYQTPPRAIRGGWSQHVAWVFALNANIRAPDLTVILDVPAEVAAERRAAAGRPVELYDDLRKQEEVAENYRLMKRACPDERIEIIDGARLEHEVHDEIVRLVLRARTR